MNYSQLTQLIKTRKTYLCVGLDTDLDKLPLHLKKNLESMLTFNKSIIDATRTYCVAYKPNTAFYERYGSKGWEVLEKTIDYIGKQHFIIADAKRGDIGNTATQYAKAFFEQLPCDAITVAPYMGSDSVQPFLNFEDKWAILLALTSNDGAFDFQLTQNTNDNNLYEQVIKTSQKWGTKANMMYVVGATKAEYFEKIRKIIPEHYLLVPGVGAQGGSLYDVSKHGLNASCGLLINNTREILYASNGNDYDQAAANKAKSIQQQMEAYLMEFNVI
jgi:orotidine-5'-phosphate decarboxylase